MEAVDPADPQVWWRLLVDAVAGLQVGNKEPANQYLAFVKQRRSADVARKAKRNLLDLSEAESWANCRHWPAWGYRHKPPQVEKPKAAPKRKRR